MPASSTRLTPPALVRSDQAHWVFVSEESGPVNWASLDDERRNRACNLELRPVVLSINGSKQCESCPHSKLPYLDRVSVERKCSNCGDPRYEASDEPGKGPDVRTGEKVFIPRALIEAQLTLTDGASFTEIGVSWLAQQTFGGGLGLRPASERIEDGLRHAAARGRAILEHCEWTAGLDLDSREGLDEAARLLGTRSYDPAFAALVLMLCSQALANALALPSAPEGARELASEAWSAGVASSLLAFGLHFERAAVRGHAIEKVRWLLEQWNRHSQNDSEAFWQELLLGSPFALTQLFSSPVVIHGERYFVGGIRAGGRHGKIADYLLRNQLTDAAMLVELKTPAVQLLYQAEYRDDVYVPSRELSGAVIQVLEQRAQFMKSMQLLQSELERDVPRIEVVEPHAVVIVGNSAQLTDRAQRRSFETFRSELRNVRVVTFDELFAKLRALAGLLGAQAPNAEADPG